MAKGEIRLKLDMEIDQAKKNVKDFYSLMEKTSKQLTEVQDKINKRDKDDFAQVLEKNLEKTTSKLNKYKEKLLQLKDEQKKAIDEINNKQNELNAKNEESHKKLLKYEEEIKELQYDLKTPGKRISASYKVSELQGLIKDEQSSINSNTDELKKLASQKEEIENNEEIKKISEECEQIFKDRQQIIDDTTKSYNAETEALRSQEAELENMLNMQATGMEQDVKTLNKLDNPFSKIKANLKDTLEKANKLGKTLLNSVGGVFNKLFHKDSTRSLNKGMTSLLGTTKRFAMSLLGAYSAYSLISKAVNQIKEDNKELANTMNSLWNGIVSLITPVVNALVNAFATALNYIMKIASVISGINILGKIKQANKKANAKSAGGSNSNKLYSFDTSETLQKNSGSGGSSTTEGYLKDVELNEKLLGYAEKLKTIWDNIAQTGKNIVDRIKEGWKYMDSGKRILTVIDNLINAFLDDIIEITQATKEWSETIDFGSLFDSIANVMESLEPLLEKIGDLFVWLWTECVLPLATYLIEELLPALNNILAPVLKIIDEVLTNIAEDLQPLWENVLQPLFKALGEVIVGALEKVGDFFERIAENETAIAILTAVGEALLAIGVALGIVATASALVNSTWLIVTVTIVAVIAVIELLIENWDNLKEGIKNGVQSIKDWFASMAEYISTTFSTAWQTAWSGIKGFFANIWNSMLDIVEGVINGMISAINWVISKLNTLHWDIPEWVPVVGGKSFGFSLNELSEVSLAGYKVPALAQGAVIPPNKEFLAMLGDQTRGRNIEAPEELLREIVQEESGTQEINIVANGTMSQLIKLLRLELQKEDKRVGSSLVVGG